MAPDFISHLQSMTILEWMLLAEIESAGWWAFEGFLMSVAGFDYGDSSVLLVGLSLAMEDSDR